MKLKKSSKYIHGQGVIEYVILTGLIGIFCLAAVKKFGTTINQKITKMERKVDTIKVDLR